MSVEILARKFHEVYCDNYRDINSGIEYWQKHYEGLSDEKKGYYEGIAAFVLRNFSLKTDSERETLADKLSVLDVLVKTAKKKPQPIYTGTESASACVSHPHEDGALQCQRDREQARQRDREQAREYKFTRSLFGGL